MPKYKVSVNQAELIQGLTDKPKHKIIDSFSELVAIKGLNPKTAGKPKRRGFITIQADRMNTNYPSKSVVAAWFNLSEIPEDYPMSSQESTIAYINRMYGIEAKVVGGRVIY